MTWTPADVCKAFVVDRRTVTNWINEDPPVPSKKKGNSREFAPEQVIRWFADRAVRHARKAWEKERPANTDEVEAAKDRRTINEARLVELELEEAEGRLIPMDLHEQRLRSLTEPLAARCKSLTKYMGDVQLAQTDVQASAVLEKIGDDLLRSLSTVADEIDADDV